jgi:hypothetical protein
MDGDPGAEWGLLGDGMTSAGILFGRRQVSMIGGG